MCKTVRLEARVTNAHLNIRVNQCASVVPTSSLCRSRVLFQMLPEKPQPVAAANQFCGIGRESSRLQCIADTWQIGAGFDFKWDFVSTEPAVHVRADGNVIRIASQIANVLHVADDIF